MASGDVAVLKDALVGESDAAKITSTLESLQNAKVSLADLKRTGVGKVINKLRKHSDAKIQALAKSLITDWKQLAKKSGCKAAANSPKVKVKSPKAKSPKPSPEVVKKKGTKRPQPSSEVAEKAKAKKGKVEGGGDEGGGWGGLQLGGTGDTLRDKIQKLFYDAIGDCPDAPAQEEIGPIMIEGWSVEQSDDRDRKFAEDKERAEAKEEGREPDFSKLDKAATTVEAVQQLSFLEIGRVEIAVRLEQAMFEKFKGTTKEYKDQYRNLRSNLADTTNQTVNYNLYKGLLLPEAAACMKPDELASDFLKKEREAYEQYNIAASRCDYNGKNGGTDMFKCERCGKSRTKYFQQQTRGADEPMTIFVTCMECGFKFRGGDNAR